MHLRLDNGQVVEITPEEARQLVDALWTVAATTRGAVATIGKIEHRLANPAAPVVELAQIESNAVVRAIDEGSSQGPGLSELRGKIR